MNYTTLWSSRLGIPVQYDTRIPEKRQDADPLIADTCKPTKRTLVVLEVAIALTWLEQTCEKWVPIASLLGVPAIGFIILENPNLIAHIISQSHQFW